MEEKEKGWFVRNWLWVIPVGGCLTIILLFVLGIGAVFFGVSNALKNSAPFEYALEMSKNHPEVRLALGENIGADGIFSGNVSFKGNRGEADLKIPIKGENGEGTIILVGEKMDDEWTYEKLYVLIKETNEEINLLDKTLEGI